MTVRKEIEEATNKWKDGLCSWLEKLILFILPKDIYRFDGIPIKTSMTFFRNRNNTMSILAWALAETCPETRI